MRGMHSLWHSNLSNLPTWNTRVSPPIVFCGSAMMLASQRLPRWFGPPVVSKIRFQSTQPVHLQVTSEHNSHAVGRSRRVRGTRGWQNADRGA